MGEKKLVHLIDKIQQNVIVPSLKDMQSSSTSLEETLKKRTLCGIYLPLFFNGTKKVIYHRVVRLLSHESRTLSSKERVKKKKKEQKFF